ncbi:MAG: cysteine hydrolase [Verrucomicrobia bacterium]|nr:cysteine hydrolase [Verrucomicrobiota bacterium]
MPNATTALLLMDLQNEIVDPKGKIGADGLAGPVAERKVIERTADLLRHARTRGIKVIHVVVCYRPGHPELPRKAPLAEWFRGDELLVEGTWGAQIHPLVAPLAGEPVVTKRGISAFAHSDLDALLRSSGITNVVLAGVATRFVVEGTARDAFDRGYQYVVLEDCCASSSPAAHDAAIAFMSSLGEVTTSEAWLKSLDAG